MQDATLVWENRDTGENDGRVYGIGGTFSTSGPGFGISADFV
jgi:hypothetical protein